MALNKAAVKRYSTYATLVSMVIGGVMTYLPDLIPDEYNGLVMLVCTGVIQGCMWIKQGGLQAVLDASET